MKQFYHIRCDPELGEGFYAMQSIPCAFTASVEQLSNTWLPHLDKTLQPRYIIKPETCKYSFIVPGYNKWHISKLP